MRGQAATEFIMTYGRAILAVMVSIGALAYFGVLNPSEYLPERCMMTSGFNCKEFAVRGADDLTLQLRFENKLGQSIRVESVNISVQGTIESESGCLPSPTVLKNDDISSFDCTIDGASPGIGKKVKLNIQMKYSPLQGTYNHTINGEIQTKVQS